MKLIESIMQETGYRRFSVFSWILKGTGHFAIPSLRKKQVMMMLNGGAYANRAPYAVNPDRSRGRLFREAESPTRTPFQRDRDRIIHSTAFRRLKHKTQVFVYHEGDHYRTRLTHTIEVSQIARSIARSLRLDEDLTECLALAHDLGHTPFGHTGEDALDLAMKDYGGFDHNAQTLRIVTSLERRYAEFDGLNLTWETLEGLVKHNGPLTKRDGSLCDKSGRPLPHAIRVYQQLQDLELSTWPSAEAQVAAISDDIAYNAHDIDDGLRAGLFSLADLESLPLLGDFLEEIESRYPNLEESRRVHELVRRLITKMVEDVITEASTKFAIEQPASVEAVRFSNDAYIRFSDRMAEADRAIKQFLFPNMYRHADVLPIRRDAEKLVRDLFDAFFADPHKMPEEWRQNLPDLDNERLARKVCDYIAGMTDRYAIAAHRRWFDETAELR